MTWHYHDDHISIAWKGRPSYPMLLDVYPPSTTSERSLRLANKPLPVLIYFHGGGMTVGDRTSWFPSWLQKGINNAGFVFISTDYSLMPPATGHQVIQDIRDLFKFVTTGGLDEILKVVSQAHEQYGFSIRADAIAVSGSSSGGLCAYMAAIHAAPRPAAVLSMYGMGGDFLIPHYLTVKTHRFFRGREILDPSDYLKYLYPQSSKLDETHESPLSYHDSTWTIPGFPANPRMLLPRLYLQLGIWLDYWTGEHEPSLSEKLRGKLDSVLLAADEAWDPSSVMDQMRELIPTPHHGLFPQFNVTKDWPPTILCHGEKDTAVPVSESKHLCGLLQNAGASAQMMLVPEAEHSFDYVSDAETLYGANVFAPVLEFLVSHMDRGE